MSLPRSDYDPRRVCLNPFPFLEKFNLGKHRRAFGVYLAGGLVSPFLPPSTLPFPTLAHLVSPVLARNLDVPRRRHPLRPRAPPCQRAELPRAGARLLRGLGPRAVLPARHPRRQPDRQGPHPRRRGLRRLARRLARAPLPVRRLCAHGGRAGWQRRTSFLSRVHTFLDHVQALLVLKYVIPGYPDQYQYYGYANVAQNVSLMLSAVVLWIAQSGSGEYEYNLSI